MALNNEELNKRRAERAKQRELRAQKKKHRIAIVVLIIVTALIAVLFCFNMGWLHWPEKKPAAEVPPASRPEETQPENTQPEATQPPKDTVIHFVAGGDMNVTEQTVAAGKTDSGFDFTNAFMDVAPILAQADLTALNFEGVLYGTQPCAAPKEMMSALNAAGVDLVQMANSYTITEGIRGLQSTLSGIRDAGMEPVGAYPDNEAFEKSGGYLLWDIQGVRVAIAAFTKGMDGMGLPAGSEHCVNLLYTDYNSTYQKVDTEGIQKVLRAMESHKPDITIALVHWGSEYNNQISPTQKKITELMQAEGVDAIIGTHSHYVQKMEFDPEKGTFVAYSLGNFFGNADKPGTNYSVLLNLEITKNGATGETKITGFDYVPVYIDKPNEDGTGMRLLRIREAMEGYESSYLGRVSEETYNAMAAAMKQIKSRVEG